MFDIIAIPFGFVLKLIYEVIGSYGLAIIVFTIFSKALVYPLTLKSKKSMRQVTKLQPKLQEIQKKYKNNKQKIQEETAKLYQQEKVNPAGSCLPMLITLPIMLGLYYVIQRPLTYMMGVSMETIQKIGEIAGMVVDDKTIRTVEIALGEFVTANFDKVSSLSDKLMAIDYNFIGFNLAATPSFKEPSILWLIPIISGLSAFASMQITQKLQGTSMEGQNASMKGMLYMMPFMSAYFGFILPAGVGIYWITGNLLMIAQEFIMNKHLQKSEAKDDAAAAELLEREKRNKAKEIELQKEEQRRIAKENLEKDRK